MDLEQLVGVVAALSGVGALITVLLNIGKTIGWVKNGQAGTISTGAGLFVMVLVYLAGILKPDLDIRGIDGLLEQIAQILAMIFTLIWPVISSKITHSALAGFPVIGKSYSLEAEREWVEEMAEQERG